MQCRFTILRNGDGIHILKRPGFAAQQAQFLPIKRGSKYHFSCWGWKLSFQPQSISVLTIDRVPRANPIQFCSETEFPCCFFSVEIKN
jgi:hypothetical protein